MGHEFIGTLAMALKPDESVWVCTFAMAQNADIEAILGNDPSHSPFAQALRAAKKHIVLLDSEMDVPDRVWCVYELALSFDQTMPIMPWFYAVTDYSGLIERVQALDLRGAKASQEKDLRMIQEIVVRDFGGYDVLNTKVKDCLMDRLKFYGSMIRNHGDELAHLQSQLVVAIAERDVERIKHLEDRRLQLSSQIGNAASIQLVEEDKINLPERFADLHANEAKGKKGPDSQQRLINEVHRLSPELADIVSQMFGRKDTAVTQKGDELGRLVDNQQRQEEKHKIELLANRQSYAEMDRELSELRRTYQALKAQNDDLVDELDAKTAQEEQRATVVTKVATRFRENIALKKAATTL